MLPIGQFLLTSIALFSPWRTAARVSILEVWTCQPCVCARLFKDGGDASLGNSCRW